MKLEKIYYAIAVIGFLGTWSVGLGYVEAGPFGGTADFWDDALNSSDAARFLTIDILVLGAAIFLMLGLEARRLGIAAKWFWIYLVGSILIGICIFVPLFLAHRERALASAGSGA
ncbi:MAG TPA: DUF2834 domain-containing protein [Nocardioidaceae bacterium]|nr:DUF2834 domain-containing protein [Nocardioidaceae bacterium]